jgi:hypothetical protein
VKVAEYGPPVALAAYLLVVRRVPERDATLDHEMLPRLGEDPA